MNVLYNMTICYLVLIIVCGFSLAMIIEDEDAARVAQAGWGTQAIFCALILLLAPVFFILAIFKEIFKALK